MPEGTPAYHTDFPFPAKPIPRTGALRGVIRVSVTGYDMRPHFTSDITAEILEKQLPEAIVNTTWRKTFTPVYPDTCGRKWIKYIDWIKKHNIPGGGKTWQKRQTAQKKRLAALATSKPTSQQARRRRLTNTALQHLLGHSTREESTIDLTSEKSAVTGTTQGVASHRKTRGIS